MNITREELLQIIKEELSVVLREKDEFPDKVHAKARYIQDKEGKSRDQAYAIAISMYEDGDLDEAKAYHWDEPDWHYNGGYGDPESPHAKWYLKKETKETEDEKVDLTLPRDEEVVLKAQDKDYDRGLVVKLLDDGGYDVYYWYENPEDVYPAEIKIDGKSITKDGKIVHIGFHPELEKDEDAEEQIKEADPKKGTGKKPKGSGRRLYTDEDPTDTVSVEFSSASAIQKTLAKSSFKSKSHKRQSQIINLIHQRARAAYKNAKDPKVKARLKKAYEYAEKRKEASKRKTVRLRKKKK